MPIRPAGWLLIAVGLAAWTSQARAGFEYRVVDLGTLARTDTGWSQATAISQAGWVTGVSTTDSGATHAFRVMDSEMQDIGSLAGPGGWSSGAGINDSGRVVGTSQGAPGFGQRAFRSSGPGTMQDLGTIRPGGWSVGTGINSAGTVVGYGSSWGNMVEAFRSEGGGALRGLGFLDGGFESRAMGVNEVGIVVGYGKTYGGVDRAFRTDATGKLIDLGTLAGTVSSYGMAINVYGRVAGYSSLSNGQSRAFVTNPNGSLQSLGMLAGMTNSTAMGLNDLGVVVGTSASASASRGFLWSEERGLVDLNSLIDPLSGWMIVEAAGINNQGLIAATAVRNNTRRAVLLDSRLVPIPEPSSLVLAGLGLLGVGAWAVRRRRVTAD